jgi:formylglycine-generating enzyme required for sulfatase activity
MGWARIFSSRLRRPREHGLDSSGDFHDGQSRDEQDRQENEGPQTQVTLTQGFFMGKYEVTQGEYLAVMGENPSWFNGVQGETDYGTNLNRPVERSVGTMRLLIVKL